jgi:hypothetical protein
MKNNMHPTEKMSFSKLGFYPSNISGDMYPSVPGGTP